MMKKGSPLMSVVLAVAMAACGSSAGTDPGTSGTDAAADVPATSPEVDEGPDPGQPAPDPAPEAAADTLADPGAPETAGGDETMIADGIASGDAIVDATGPDLPEPPQPWELLQTTGWYRKGNPAWTLADFQFFQADCGPAPGMPNLLNAALEVAPGHQVYPDPNVIGPGTPHAPPYDQELSRVMWAKGRKWTLELPPAAFSAPACAMLMFVIVPSDVDGTTPPVGATPDFASGPLLDPATTPFEVLAGIVATDPEPIGMYTSTIPALADLVPLPSGDGYSHVVVAAAFNLQTMTAAPNGAYTVAVTVNDAAGGSVSTHFGIVVKDPPKPPEGCQNYYDVVMNQGCPDGQSCDIGWGSQWGMTIVKATCRNVGTTPLWETCAGSENCVAGTTCDTQNGWRGCYPFCGTSKPCPQGTTCTLQSEMTGAKLCTKP